MKTFMLGVSLIFVASISWADMTAFNQNPNTYIPPVLSISDSAPHTSAATDLQKITVDHLSSDKAKPALVKQDPAVKVRSYHRFTSEDFEAEQAVQKSSVLNRTAPVSKYADFVNSVSPDYVVNRNFLALTKIPQERRKRAIMFVFLMNKPKVDPNKPVMKYDKSRSRLHIMGPKRVITDQKVVDDEYPINFSIAKYDDGYSNDEWNLILPNKKPREIFVSLLWNF